MPKWLRTQQWSVHSKLALAFVVVALVPLGVFTVISLSSTNSALQSQVLADTHTKSQAFAAVLRSRETSLYQEILDFAQWNAFCTAIDRRDTKWMRGNVTVWTVNNMSMSGAQVLMPDGTLISGAGDFSHGSLYALPVVEAAGKTGRNGVDLQLIDGRLFIVAAGPVIEESGHPPRKHGIVIFGSALGSAALTQAAAFTGARELDLYVRGRPIASSAASAAGKLPAAERTGTAFISGASAVLLTELRDRSGKPLALQQVSVSLASAAAARAALQKTAVYAVALALLIAIGVGIVWARVMSRPLRQLASAARAIADGETRQHVDVATGDEFGEVADAFNTMSERLEASFAHLQSLSDTDSLTSVANHRKINEFLTREHARAERYAGSFTLVMLDLDDFKLLNDTHGHPAGDAILRQVAELLTDRTRDSDMVGRYGGDEFLLVMPETNPSEAMALAENLREVLASSGYETPEGDRIPLHASFGIAGYPEDARDANELIVVADANLYASKRRGGDAVTGVQEEGPVDPDSSAFGLIDSLVTAVDNKDIYTRRHSGEVTEYALTLAVALGLSEASQRVLRVAGLLHDVGKIGIPDRILRRPGRLTTSEFEIVKMHPTMGATILTVLPHSGEIRAAVASHHERYDGGGYPHGLATDEIPLLGRILAVADAYSAMTTDRPYCRALSCGEATLELRAGAGSQFDPELVEAFIAFIEASDDVASGVANRTC